jgi:hypothetical protein
MDNNISALQMLIEHSFAELFIIKDNPQIEFFFILQLIPQLNSHLYKYYKSRNHSVNLRKFINNIDDTFLDIIIHNMIYVGEINYYRFQTETDSIYITYWDSDARIHKLFNINDTFIFQSNCIFKRNGEILYGSLICSKNSNSDKIILFNYNITNNFDNIVVNSKEYLRYKLADAIPNIDNYDIVKISRPESKPMGYVLYYYYYLMMAIIIIYIIVLLV